MVVNIGDTEGLGERLVVGFHGLELVGGLGSSTLACGLEEGSQTDAGKASQEGAGGSGEDAGVARGVAQEGGELVAQDTGEEVDVELLVGPVELGSYGQMMGIFEVAEGVFDAGLGVVGVDDVFGRPIVAVGHQDAETELVFDVVEGCALRAEAQGEASGLVLFEGGVKEPWHVLPFEQVGDLGFELVAAAWPRARVGELALELA